MTKTTNQEPEPPGGSDKQSQWAIPMILIVIAGFALGIYLLKGPDNQPENPSPAPTPHQAAAPAVVEPAATPNASEPGTMQTAQAVMVTVNLSFPQGLPSIAQAVTQIERRYESADGTGRTFAILDAYGEPTADGKLHISMHVSSEKPGTGSLIFKPTGEVLWHSSISGSPAPENKNLNIYVTDEAGTSWIVDGSGSPASIFDAKIRDKGVFVRDFWPDGAERELTFVYSACGCPVKAMVKRTGDRTSRTKELPVLFPDDPGVVQVISRLMRWTS